MKIFDSHFHIWDIEKLNLLWLDDVIELKKSFSIKDLTELYDSVNGVEFEGGIYVEVDCVNTSAEDEYVNENFNNALRGYVARATLSKSMRLPLNISGIREPLHTKDTRKNRFKETSFNDGLALLESKNIPFDLCINPEDLKNSYETFKHFKDLKIIINHLGNIKSLDDDFMTSMSCFASLPNVYVKLSGLKSIHKNKEEILRFFTNEFGKDRLMYSSNFPVIDSYYNFNDQINFLLDYFNGDINIFSKTAKKIYGINKTQIHAQIIHIKKSKIKEYIALHKQPFNGVNEMIRKSGITSYKIFLRNNILFSVFAYEGDDFDHDMKMMAEDPLTRQWWQATDPCQYRIKGASKEEWWADATLVYDLNASQNKNQINK